MNMEAGACERCTFKVKRAEIEPMGYYAVSETELPLEIMGQ